MEKLTVLVDDDRVFIEPRDYIVARTSQAALDTLHVLRSNGQVVDELWLDHDLGNGDDVLPVLTMLSELAARNEPYPVRQIYVHSMNRSGADTLMRSLRTYGYPVQRAIVSKHLITV